MEKKSDYSFTISPSAAENIEKIVRYISLDLKNLKAADDLIALFYEKNKRYHLFSLFISNIYKFGIEI